MGYMEEKYPYGDKALMYGIYVQELKPNQTAIDKNVLIVSPEAAISIYEAMLLGKPQAHRYITLCGDDINGGNFCIPRGMTTKDFYDICGGIPRDKLIIENTLLSGKPIENAINDGTMALIATKATSKKRSDCIFCGKCALACPQMLFPNEILAGGKNRIKSKCISCR